MRILETEKRKIEVERRKINQEFCCNLQIIHHHHVDRSRTSMTLFFQYSLSRIAVSKFSLSRLVSSVSWLIKFRAGLLVFLSHFGSHSIILCITSLVRKQCPAKLTICFAIVLVILNRIIQLTSN